MKFLAVILGSVFLVALECSATNYTPDWPSLDSRPLPEATNPAQSYQKPIFQSLFELSCKGIEVGGKKCQGNNMSLDERTRVTFRCTIHTANIGS